LQFECKEYFFLLGSSEVKLNNSLSQLDAQASMLLIIKGDILWL